MPSSVNGIGTTYYGRRNLETETGVCESCNRQTTLSTYETTHWFIVIFIPLIPLGKKQIIDDCSVCRRHRVLPAADWQRIREESIEASSTQLAGKMDDPKAAIEHLQTLTAFRQMDEARDLSEAIEVSHASDFDVQFFLGAWHEKYGQAATADRCFDKAFEIDPKNPAALRAKAMGLMEQGKFDEAKVILQQIAPPSEHFDPGVFYQLGLGFQSQERHQDALEQFKLVSSNAPTIGRDKDFRKAVKRSEKATGATQSSILPKQSIFGSSVFWWGVGVAALFAALIGGSIWVASDRTVHVVNGNAQAITVQIDGDKSVTVSPGRFRKIQLSEGSHEVEVTSPSVGIPKKQFKMSSSIFSRFFTKPAFVLDPTETAAVVFEETVYSDNPRDDDGDFSIEVGNVMTQFRHIDFAFREFPNSLKVDSNSSRVTKTRVSILPFPPAALLAGAVDLSPSEQLDLIETHLKIDPTSQDDWAIYYTAGKMHNQLARCTQFMEPQLETKPVNVELHRTYQESIKETDGGEAKLLTRYDRYLKQDSNNPDIIYLNGRLRDISSESNPFFDKALKLDPEHKYALNAIAYNEMAGGEYADASRKFEKLVNLDPDNEQYREEYIESLFAKRDYRTLERVLGKLDMDNFHNFKLKANLKMAQKRERSLPNLLTDYVSQNPGRAAANRAEMHLAYLKENIKEFQEKITIVISPMEQTMHQVEVDIELGTVSKTRDLLKELPPQINDHYLPLVAMVYSQKGDKTQGKRIWNEFLDEMDKRGEHHFVKVARQAMTEDVSIDDFLEFSSDTDSKRIFAAAMLEFSKTPNAELRKVAEQMNFSLSFPHNFLKRSLK